MSCRTCDESRLQRCRWGHGPWVDEPDYKIGEAAGLVYQVHREMWGTLAIYLGFPPGHPCFELDYECVRAHTSGLWYWSAHCTGHIKSYPDEEYAGLWWLGAQFGRPGQLAPLMANKYPGRLAAWRYITMAEAEAEARRLCRVLS